jgi:hypothetical protein
VTSDWARADGRHRGRYRLVAVDIVADAADGADGIFLSGTYPNDPASGPAFATEGNVDAQYPQERLRDGGGQRARDQRSCINDGGAHADRYL